MSDAIKAAEYVERLLDYGENKGLLCPVDRMFARNSLLDELRLTAPCEVYERNDTAELHELLEPLLDFAVESGIIEDGVTERDLFYARLAGHITPMPSAVLREYEERLEKEGFAAASDRFYDLCGDCGYIRRERIARNIIWDYDAGDCGQLTITINLTKPELDPVKQAALKLIPATGYPKCQLCRENEGFAGNLRHPARQNLRMLPLNFDGEEWWFQYSPYVYFYKHCIVFSGEHRDMLISQAGFRRLLQFTDMMPGYFIGSNADLPLVGGSVLTHDHYQGGFCDLPMSKTGVRTAYKNTAEADVEAGILEWPMSAIRLTSENREALEAAGGRLLELWRGYSEPEAGVYAVTEAVPKNIQHNTITPIARKRNGRYELDLILRCNIKSDENPKGEFHPHMELHHIKQENIGLIEAQGLFILPGRLKKELGEVEKVLTGRRALPDWLPESDCLEKHLPWLKELAARYGTSMTAEAAKTAIQQEVGSVCHTILKQCGVFKEDERGQALFERFLNKAGFVKC